MCVIEARNASKGHHSVERDCLAPTGLTLFLSKSVQLKTQAWKLTPHTDTNERQQTAQVFSRVDQNCVFRHIWQCWKNASCVVSSLFVLSYIRCLGKHLLRNVQYGVLIRSYFANIDASSPQKHCSWYHLSIITEQGQSHLQQET